MAIIKMEGINKRYTEVVAQYIAQGLTIDAEAMRGSQGEIARVALANEKNVYIIYLHEESIGRLFDGHDVAQITVEMFVREANEDAFTIYWLGKGETVYEETFHQVSDGRRRGGKIWTDDEAEWMQSWDKQTDRAKNWGPSFGRDVEVKYNAETVISVIKARTGRKRVAQENIVKVTKRTDRNSWNIQYMFSGRKNSLTVSYSA